MAANMKSLLIGALIVAVVVLGYSYYQNQRSTIQIQLPTAQDRQTLRCSAI
jgi:predicted negative regulator of RcsB-dependent stress response